MNQNFPYILRISEKAKHVRFQVSVEKGLEIVVPKRFSASRVPSLVEKNSQWIERAFQKAKAFQGLIDPMPVWQMPEEITSLALDLTWRVLTRRDDMKSVVVRETSATTLVMRGATDDAAACQTALKGWLTHKAEEHDANGCRQVGKGRKKRRHHVAINEASPVCVQIFSPGSLETG